MIIADAGDDGFFAIVDREKDMIKLGAEVFRTGRLSERMISAGVGTLRKFKLLAERHGATTVVSVATSAVREAENGAEFLHALHRHTGLTVRTVSGLEEARLIHLGVAHMLDLTRRRAMIIDAGGGSVEVIVGDAKEILHSESLKLGALRLSSWVEDDGPLSKEERRRVESRIREEAEPLMKRAREIGFEVCVGTAGTILALGLGVHMRRWNERWSSPDGRTLRREDLRGLTDELVRMDLAERESLSWIDGHRADTIHLGGVLLTTMLELARVESLVLCDASIREGLLIEHLRRTEGWAGDPSLDGGGADIRRRSVMRLLREFEPHDEHAPKVRDLALQLFDQTRSLHGLSDPTRELLEYASLLHDIGRRIGFERHEHHSSYLIRNGGLRGFTDQEIELIALVARYHRKSSPKPRHRDMAGLAPRDRRVVRVLAGILRIAEGLERGHARIVRSVRCEITPARLRVVARTNGDGELEAWAARRKSSLLARALERSVDVDCEERDLEPEDHASVSGIADRR